MLPIIVIIAVRISRVLKRKKLIDFLSLDSKNPEITIYLSRFQTKALLPRIEVSASERSKSYALKKLYECQLIEDKRPVESPQISPQEFAAVAAIEMIEFIRLKDEIERPTVLDWLPKETQEALFLNQANVSRIKVKLEVCPEPNEYQKILEKKGTIIFIGGPRSNLGAYYYLYGEEAGIARPKRLISEKNFIDRISPLEPFCDTPNGRNLGMIQRHKLKDKTIIYLAGTGLNGTAAAVAYIRKRWSELLKCYNKCPVRKQVELCSLAQGARLKPSRSEGKALRAKLALGLRSFSPTALASDTDRKAMLCNILANTTKCYNKENFCVVLEVIRREKDDLTEYVSKDWPDKGVWWERKRWPDCLQKGRPLE